MDKSDTTMGRRDFIRVVGGALALTELGAVACGEGASQPAHLADNSSPAAAGEIPTTPPNAATSVAGMSAPPATNMVAAAGSSGAQVPVGDKPSGVGAAGGPARANTPPASSGNSAGSPATSTASAGGSAPAAGSGGAGRGVADSGKARIYIVKTSNRAEGIAQALTMFGGLGFVAGRDVVIKPNFNSQNPFPATTHDDTIRTVVAKLKAANAGTITLGESSGATTGSPTPTATVIQSKGTVAFCQDIGIEFQSYDDPGVEFETFDFDGMTWSGGLAIPKLMRSDRVKVLLPCCKTHTLADYTFSMKIAAGLPPRSRRGLISDMHTSLQEKVVDINMGFTPDLIVMDALQCFIDNGPDSGTKADPGLIIVGTDRVAVDAVGVAILKNAGSVTPPLLGKIFETRQIARAVEIGLGITKSPDDIELVGNDDATLSKLRSILDMG